MKTTRAINYNKGIFLIVSIAFALFMTISLGSCARKMTFGVSPIVPAATGKIKIKKSKNENYIVDVSVLNLAPPNRLTPPREVYVVWMQNEQNSAKNIGMIKSSTSLLSNTFKGDMKATTMYKPREVFITAEDNGDVQFPGSQVVLKTQ